LLYAKLNTLQFPSNIGGWVVPEPVSELWREKLIYHDTICRGLILKAFVICG
jgi:hypothetical protein